MKISYNWLKQYLDIDYSVEELEQKLTFAGIEVEEVQTIGDELKDIIISEIVDKQKHPQSEKLSICQVNNGKEVLQIVCGAPNCAIGQKVALAPIGANIGDFKIKKAKLRGELSFGMLCSEHELGISANHDGIMVVDNAATLGTDMATYLNVSDTVYDVEITPNRPDLLGMIGVARDLSALLSKTITLPVVSTIESDIKIANNLKLVNKVPEKCTRYTAKVIKNVSIGESPDWLKQRLISIGLRPINNIVDITNFVMMEFGHPLHAFDYDKLSGKTIIIRNAQKDEKFSALDNNDYKLINSDLVVADAEKPVALAGIIGSTNSHITENTTNIVLEAANFKYSSVRKTAGRLNIVTDSGYRFERNLSDSTTEIVSNRATQLIMELAGGQVLNGTLESYPNPSEKLVVALRPERVQKILGIEIPHKKIIDYLTALGLDYLNDISDDMTMNFVVPAYRRDLSREIDLIEEIIRLNGYNNVPTKMKIQTIMDKDGIFTRRKVKNVLVNNGFSEILNWSFGDPKDFDLLQLNEDDPRRDSVTLKNPLGTSFSIMRSILLPSLMKNANYNINHGNRNIKTFELAKTFRKGNDKLAIEEYNVCGIMSGNINSIHWKEKPKEITFFEIKGVVEEILSSLCLTKVIFKNSIENFYQKGMRADIFFKGKKIGSVGKIDMLIAEKYDISLDLYAFDLNLGLIKCLQKKVAVVFKDIPKFPPALRDLSFTISKDIDVASIINQIKNTNSNIIKDVILFDVFEGGKIETGYHSLSFNLILGSDKKTLTDDFINKIINKIIKVLEFKFDIKMR